MGSMEKQVAEHFYFLIKQINACMYCRFLRLRGVCCKYWGVHPTPQWKSAGIGLQFSKVGSAVLYGKRMPPPSPLQLLLVINIKHAWAKSSWQACKMPRGASIWFWQVHPGDVWLTIHSTQCCSRAYVAATAPEFKCPTEFSSRKSLDTPCRARVCACVRETWQPCSLPAGVRLRFSSFLWHSRGGENQSNLRWWIVKRD